MSVLEIKQYQVLFLLHQIFICKIVILPELPHFWDIIQIELADEGPYIICIESIKIRLPKLQDNDKETKKLRSEQILVES